MIALRWLYDAMVRGQPGYWEGRGPVLCYLCAAPCPDTSPSQPTKQAIRDTFTDADLAHNPEGAWVCPACAYYLDHCGARSDGLINQSWRIHAGSHRQRPARLPAFCVFSGSRKTILFWARVTQKWPQNA